MCVCVGGVGGQQGHVSRKEESSKEHEVGEKRLHSEISEQEVQRAHLRSQGGRSEQREDLIGAQADFQLKKRNEGSVKESKATRFLLLLSLKRP